MGYDVITARITVKQQEQKMPRSLSGWRDWLTPHPKEYGVWSGTKFKVDPHLEADLALPCLSSPEEDHIQGFSVQPALRLSKAGVLAEVDELEVVHSQGMDPPCRTPLRYAVTSAIHAEVLEALLQGWVALVAYSKQKLVINLLCFE